MNNTFTFAVGPGGAGSESISVRGDNGGDTTLEFGIVNVRSYGGGGGGSRSGSSGLTGSSGGSGGGASSNTSGTLYVGGTAAYAAEGNLGHDGAAATYAWGS